MQVAMAVLFKHLLQQGYILIGQNQNLISMGMLLLLNSTSKMKTT